MTDPVQQFAIDLIKEYSQYNKMKNDNYTRRDKKAYKQRTSKDTHSLFISTKEHRYDVFK